MSKAIKIGIVAFLLVVMSGLVVFGIYLQNMNNMNQAEVAKIYVKRDDLLANQQRIEATLNDLNRTINGGSVNPTAIPVQSGSAVNSSGTATVRANTQGAPSATTTTASSMMPSAMPGNQMMYRKRTRAS